MSIYKILFSALIILNSNLSFSQKIKTTLNSRVDSTTSDEKNLYNAQWQGFDIGFMSTNKSDQWSNKIIQSTSIGLNVFEYKIPLFKQYIGITSGLGFNFKTYTFGDDYSFISTDYKIDLVTGNPSLYDASATVKYSTLNLGFFQIPLLLDFSTKKSQKKSISLAVGVVGGIRLFTNHRLQGKYSNGDKFNNVIIDNKYFHTNLLSLDGMVRVAYGPFGLFGTYSLNGLFKKDAVEKISPISIGVSFNAQKTGSKKSRKEKKVTL
ncbi:MAG: hypothetical protein EBR35_05540 [Flavobacteriales bacterium]|nr:hypothetical protein [Flavobacteriales bacterium]NDA97923.1 hypothetical protein [Flavobacteriia bacterium]NDC92565.1 hypothetical protein [Flavobacteriales bacterium]